MILLQFMVLVIACNSYCFSQTQDPTWTPQPNIAASLHGIDLPKRGPLTFELNDISKKGQLFQPTMLSSNNSQMDYFPTYSEHMICDSKYSLKHYSNYEEYAFDSSTSTIVGFDLSYTGIETEDGQSIGDSRAQREIGLINAQSNTDTTSNSFINGMDLRNNRRTTKDQRRTTGGQSLASRNYRNSVAMTPPPNSATINVGYSNKESRLQNFFKKEKGSVTKGKAQCFVYDVVVDIEHPSLVLHSSFAEAIKKIDRAVSKAEAKESMKNLMDNFGTHYSKKTKMGVGLEFETRFTEKDNLVYDVKTKDSCNGFGAHASGIGVGGNYEQCPQNRRNAPNIVNNSGLKKFESKSYGVLTAGTSSLADWAILVQEQVRAETIQPLPIEEDLVPIFNILKHSEAVKALKNDNGELVNHDKILAIAAEWFGRYCDIYDCKESTCADKVEMNGEIYQDTKTQLPNGSKLYKSEQTGDVLFNKDGWTIAHGSNFTNKHKSLACPQENVQLHDAMPYMILPLIDSWNECADQCQKLGPEKCSYWQHSFEEKLCTLIKDFSHATYINSNLLKMTFGARDCPADGKTLFSNGINCPEKSGTKSMWQSTEDNVFTKSFKLKAFDADITLITSPDGNEIIGEGQSENRIHFPNFPPDMGDIVGHSMILTKGDHKILTCIDKSCYELEKSKWKHHSELTTERRYAIPISMPNGVYLFGGSEKKSYMTSSFLPMHESEWVTGLRIPSPGIIKGCGVPVSSQEIMLIGGQDTKFKIVKCNVNTKVCTEMPMTLQIGRYSHSCEFFGGDKILVTGGKDRNGRDLKSAEIVYLSSNTTRKTQDLNQPRSEFALASPGSGQFPRILAIGGDSNGIKLNSIEYWMDEDERWVLMPLALNRNLSDIGYLDVPSIALDQRFKDNAKSIKTHHEDLSKALKWNTKCYFDDELNAFLETCTEPWNERCSYKVEKCLHEDKEKDRLIKVATVKVMSKLSLRIKREINDALSFPFSSIETTDDFKDMIARCSKDYAIEKQWFLHPQTKCNNLTYAKGFDDYKLLKNLRIIQDGCVPKWIGVKQRASFYIDCAERFNIKGFLSSAEMNIRHINTLAHKLRKHEKDSADAKWGGGAAQVAGGLLGFLGIVLAPISAGGSLALTVLGASATVGGAVSSAYVSFDTHSDKLVRQAKKRENVLLKDMDFLEKLLILYLGSNQEADDDMGDKINENVQEEIKRRIIQQLTAVGSLSAATPQAIKALTEGFVKFDDVVSNYKSTSSTGNLASRTAFRQIFVRYLQRTGNSLSATLPSAISSISKSAFAVRAAKALKLSGKAAGNAATAIAPLASIGFGIWDIIDGTNKRWRGGISNNVHVHSTALAFRMQEMAHVYTVVTGIDVTHQSIEYTFETINGIHIYSNEGVWMKLRIFNGVTKCTTEELKTEWRSGSANHTYLSTDSELLGDCDGFEILNGTAEIKVVSADGNDVVHVSEINFITNGRFIPSMSCEGGEPIYVKGNESHLWQKCTRKNAISKIKTHTSTLDNAGTNAGIYMTFMLKNKTSGDIIEKCERLEVTKELDNWGDDRKRSSIDIYHVADKGLCEKVLGDIAEGFWDDRTYQLSVELYNDGSGTGPAWHFDLLKIYFMGLYDSERVVRCFADSDGIWLHSNERKTINCELYQPRNPQRSLEALGVHTCDRVQAGSNSDKIRLRFCRSEESATLKANSLDDGVDCCEMNRFGYYNHVDLNRDERLVIDGNADNENGELDDGGDKLGQCEGFEIRGQEVYVTVQNPFHGGWCLDELEFYGRSKYSSMTNTIPFTACSFAPFWSDSNVVKKEEDSDWKNYRDVAIKCDLGNNNMTMSMEVKVCNTNSAGTRAIFKAVFTNWNNQTCETPMEGLFKPNEFVKLEISTECKAMDAGSEMKMIIVNHNLNANDDVCLETIFLNVASPSDEATTRRWRCRIGGDADFTMYFQGENTGLALVCSP